MISVCGVKCADCPHFGQDCAGCDALAGRVFWAPYVGADTCPIYECVREKSYRNCGDCPRVPCDTWVNLKDPAWSDAEHEKSIRDRLAVLKAQK
jgi:hypothetical protein